MDLHHLPKGTRPLAPGPGTLVRLTFQMRWCPRLELHRHCAHFKCAVSLYWTTWAFEMVAREGFAPSTFPF